ncbi:MAG: dTDP-4-dehydrorhamnose 3,5-epimerase family protein [Ignavibacteria bacterium]|nr:dTDP-4-dehydrorhamnose 3,5-epimerase family protein [Ignavibacteria bacterium]
MLPNEPTLIKGGIAVDDRGAVSFVNDFNFEEVKRFYMVENHTKGFIRAWHGHKKEGKYVFIPKGSAIVACVKIDNWDNPSAEAKVHRYVMSEKTPSVLYIPPGYANGFMNLSDDLKIQFFSTSYLQDSLNDDFRFEARYWNPWSVEER